MEQFFNNPTLIGYPTMSQNFHRPITVHRVERLEGHGWSFTRCDVWRLNVLTKWYVRDMDSVMFHQERKHTLFRVISPLFIYGLMCYWQPQWHRCLHTNLYIKAFYTVNFKLKYRWVFRASCQRRLDQRVAIFLHSKRHNRSHWRGSV